jgi:hypothetical protein
MQEQKSNTKIDCIEITQKKADKWLRKLYDEGDKLRENFEKAFHAEKERMGKNEEFWALSPEERTYYIVFINDEPVLLAGINKFLNISSFTKIALENIFKGKGRYCVKELIEDVIVPKCKDVGRESSYVCIYTEKGKRTFEYLMKNLPEGVDEIEPTGNGFAIRVRL